MEKLRLVRDTKYFQVWVVKLPDDKLPLYGAVHKDTDVLEFSHNVVLYVLGWVDAMDKHLDEYYQGELANFDVPNAKEFIN